MTSSTIQSKSHSAFTSVFAKDPLATGLASTAAWIPPFDSQCSGRFLSAHESQVNFGGHGERGLCKGAL